MANQGLLEFDEIIKKASNSEGALNPRKRYSEYDYSEHGEVIHLEYYTSPVINTYSKGEKWYSIIVDPIDNPNKWEVHDHREEFMGYQREPRLDSNKLGSFDTFEAAAHFLCEKYNYHSLDITQLVVILESPQHEQQPLKSIGEFKDEREFELIKSTLKEPGPYIGTRTDEGQLRIWVVEKNTMQRDVLTPGPASKVMTWQTLIGEKINITPEQEKKAYEIGHWPRSGDQTYSLICKGLHDGLPTYTDVEWEDLLSWDIKKGPEVDGPDYRWIDEEIKKLQSSGDEVDIFLEQISETYPEYFYQKAIKDHHPAVSNLEPLFDVNDCDFLDYKKEMAHADGKPLQEFQTYYSPSGVGYLFYSTPTVAIIHDKYESQKYIVARHEEWGGKMAWHVYECKTAYGLPEGEMGKRFKTLDDSPEKAVEFACEKFNAALKHEINRHQTVDRGLSYKR